MQQGRMSEMEKLIIQEQLKAEELCAKKVQMYMNQARDPAVQSVLRQMSDKSQRHINALNGIMQQELGTMQ